jgi:predicted PhzF superfamily epimerase YddE/YHI9
MSKEYTAAKLGLNASDLSERYPIEVIDAGPKTLIVPIERLSKEITIYPQEQVLKHFCIEHGFDIILVYTLQ